MPLDRIYTTRHGHRLNWTIDLKTGTYHSQWPTPTGNPADPTLTSHGVRQSFELAAHVNSPHFSPKPFRIYSSPFYRCLQTIKPTVEELKNGSQEEGLDVRIENGLGEWFGPTSFFDHPSAVSPQELQTHFPTLLSPASAASYKPVLIPSTRGETIAQLHDRVATTLEALIAQIDAEVEAEEARDPESRSSKALLICGHAAPLIAIGRALTGNMPEDSSEEDIHVFTACMTTFSRRKEPTTYQPPVTSGVLAPGTVTDRRVPDWRGGRGVGGGWEILSNGDCSYLSQGAERGWHFNGEESFDTGPMAPPSEAPTSGESISTDILHVPKL